MTRVQAISATAPAGALNGMASGARRHLGLMGLPPIRGGRHHG